MPPDFAFCFAERHVDGQHFDAPDGLEADGVEREPAAQTLRIATQEHHSFVCMSRRWVPLLVSSYSHGFGHREGSETRLLLHADFQAHWRTSQRTCGGATSSSWVSSSALWRAWSWPMTRYFTDTTGPPPVQAQPPVQTCCCGLFAVYCWN